MRRELLQAYRYRMHAYIKIHEIVRVTAAAANVIMALVHKPSHREHVRFSRTGKKQDQEHRDRGRVSRRGRDK